MALSFKFLTFEIFIRRSLYGRREELGQNDLAGKTGGAL
jgi:hypothetical protein